jgi:hypothetical protein
MNVLVVDPDPDRRAELVHAICELPGVIVRAATADSAHSRAMLVDEVLDVVAVGSVSQHELSVLRVLADNQLACTLIVVATADELVGALRSMTDDVPTETPRGFAALASRAKNLAFQRDWSEAGLSALSHHLGSAKYDPDDAPREIVLQDWLPHVLERLRPLVPEYVELAPLVAADTPPAHCMPSVLEHVLLELLLRAATALPWGGTIWVIAERGTDGQVRLDVVENHRGTGHDLSLRAVPSTAS